MKLLISVVVILIHMNVVSITSNPLVAIIVDMNLATTRGSRDNIMCYTSYIMVMSYLICCT